ncbi:AAA family ATPase [Lysinibacillus sp. YS11]|uniref:ABC transporter ATP-binding protein n=2 Tax=Lysinibacillus TaxID=400634 RepID=A0A2X0ZGD5_9BACI|nr:MULTISPECIES: AAA family ATPase [Lysinibacillus]AUS86449.1 AAA family ATPase [Lysinibacillus sp. YS11]KGR80938.1 ATPase AAA [Lysinibacillus boronitolerans JCM 21713 = 10a = NBRC 103108]MCM0623090.1 AAA family ATPase [Lysinibacillus sp. OL1_EC]MED3796114.1 AAA family ATPase [Lysinibacillus capsici]OCX62479.1 AAA family ATPase [Lysinibacillus sp. AR18-8]
MYLKSCKVLQDTIPNKQEYPFNIPSLQDLHELEFPTNVTFFVGENGSGKSTLLEAIADRCDFNTAGGGRQNLYEVHKAESSLGEYIRLSWLPKISNGFFLRSETFYQFASHIDLIEDPRRYNAFGGKSLHHQSHGESFLALFMNRFKGKAIYLLDEPEAALSPTRQLSLLKIMKDLEHEAQFIIATHSPILLGYPNATIYSFDQGEIESIRYEDTIHYIVTKRFLDAPQSILRELFDEERES